MAVIQVLGQSLKGAGLNAPKIAKVDKIESSGSLLLLDVSQVTPGNIATSTSLPNLFEDNAKKLSGASTSLVYNSGVSDTTLSKIERTPKGGIAYYNKHAGQPIAAYPSGNYLNISCGGGVKSYIKNNFQGVNDHSFYFSSWVNLPEYNGITTYLAQYCAETNHNIEKVFYIATAGGGSVTGPNRLVSQSVHGVSSPMYPSDTTLFFVHQMGWNGLFKAGGQTTKMTASSVFYRFYIEDLTVSGRSFADVSALDQQLFNEAFAVGGKFYNDTIKTQAVLFP